MITSMVSKSSEISTILALKMPTNRMIWRSTKKPGLEIEENGKKKKKKIQIQKYLNRFKKNLNVQYLEISYATTSARYFGSALTFMSISSRSTCGSFDISSTWLWDQKWKVKDFGILMQAIIWKTKKITKKENKHNTQKHKWVKRYFN